MSLSWRGAAVEPGEGPPTAAEWQPVEVPGRPAAFAGAEAVAYRTEFADPRTGDEEHVVLVLDGAWAHTRVWLNGERVADHDAHVAPLRVPLAVEADNELVVECRRPEDRFGGLHDTDAVPEAARTPAIRWDARLETHPDPHVAALSVEPRVDEAARVAVEATVVTDEPLDERLTLSLRPEGETRGGGMMERAPVETEPGRTTVSATLEVRDPSLWWPHDRGLQPRYAVRAKLGDAERRAVTGLRSVRYDDGLVVNGERVPARGVVLTDAEPADIERAADLNANLVRARAHALSPAVYEAADEHGVLVWQDLPLTGPGAFDPERGRELATALVAARNNHPSLAAVSVHDDPVADYAEGLGSGVLDRLRYRWRAWRADYDPADARAVAEAVEGVPTVPVVGPVGIDPDAATMYPGWDFGAPGDVDWLCDRYGVEDAVGAFGAGSLGTGEDGPGFDTARHDACVEGGREDSQAHQAAVVGSVAETLRMRGVDALAVDSLRDLGGAGTGVYDADGTPKPAADRLRRAYEPVQAVLADPTPGESDVVVLYDRPDPGSVTVEWDVDGEREQRDLDVEPYGRVAAGTVSPSEGATVTLAVAVGDAVARNEYEI